MKQTHLFFSYLLTAMLCDCMVAVILQAYFASKSAALLFTFIGVSLLVNTLLWLIWYFCFDWRPYQQD